MSIVGLKTGLRTMWMWTIVAACTACGALGLCLGQVRAVRKRAVNKGCADSVQFFQFLVDNSLDIITVVDRDGTILYVSPAVEPILGHAPQEQIGKRVASFIHPEDCEVVRQAFHELLSTSSPSGVPPAFRYQHKDGTWRWLESKYSNRLNEPAIQGVVVTSRDITAEKQAEAALHESEQRFRESFNAAPIGMALLSLEGRLLSANRSLCELLGYAEHELQGLDFRAVTHPEDQAISAALYDQLRTENGGTREIEKRYIHKNGKTIWARLQATVIHSQDGKLVQFLAQIQNVSQQRAADQAIRDAERRFRQLTENIEEVFWILDPSTSLLHYISPAYEKIWQRPVKDVLEGIVSHFDSIHPDDRQDLEEKRSAAGAAARMVSEYRIVRPDGSIRWIQDRAFPVFDELGKLHRYAGIAADVTDNHERQEQLDKLMLAVQQSPAAVVITDTQGRIEFVNPKFSEITGYAAADAIGRTPALLNSGVHPPEFFREMWRTIAAGNTWRGEICNKRKDGTLYWESASISAVRNSRGEIINYVAVKEDVTPRKQAEARIAEMAYHDALTGLSNRVQLQDRMDQAVHEARRRRELVALHYVDLDRFKVVNDTLGHAVGDELLKAVAGRLRNCIRHSDTAARIGGDEFAILQVGVADQEGAHAFAQRVLEAMAAPYQLAGRTIHVSPSIGVSIFPLDSNGPQQLLQHADMAMYLAKKEGRNHINFFTEKLYAQVRDKMSLESDMHGALERNEFLLHFQPQVNLRTHRITGIEALVRWHHPVRGLVPPNQFISLAEECGLISELTRWVLEQACAQNAAWQAAGLPRCRMAVNVSPADFKRGDLCDVVADVLGRTGLAPEYLELEVTESMLLHDEQVLEAVPKLRQMGVTMSIDDFGTGYSSLNYLRRLPVNKLKIDGSFIRGLPASTDDAIIAGAIVELGHAMGLTVIAEGMETKEQILCLRSKGCDEGQGYFFGRPMEAAAIESMLQAERRHRQQRITEPMTPVLPIGGRSR